MKKISFILIIAIVCTCSAYAASWSGSNAEIVMEPSKTVDISVNSDFSVGAETDFTTVYGADGYRGYTSGMTLNIKDSDMGYGSVNPKLPLRTIDNEHGLSLKLEPTAKEDGTLNVLNLAITRFKIDDMSSERSDYDFGSYNRMINMDTPFVKSDCSVKVKFDVYMPAGSSLSKIQLNSRPIAPGSKFYTYQTYVNAQKPDFNGYKTNIAEKKASDLTPGQWATIEKEFKFSDYEKLKQGINQGGYISIEIAPAFTNAENPVVYIDNFQVSYVSPAVYQTPDTNMISKIEIGESYKNSGWITEDNTVTYGDGTSSYKFVPHKGYPRTEDYAIFNSNFYRDLTMTLADNIEIKSDKKYRFSCMVKADSTATLIDGAYLKLHKNGDALTLVGTTNEIVADGQWHELSYDFSGLTDLKTLQIGVGKNSRESFVDYDHATGVISNAETITFHVANPKISVLPVYLELELIKEDAKTAAAVIQNLSPNDTYFKGMAIIAEYNANDELVNVKLSEVDEQLEAYEGRSATRVRIDNIGEGNTVKAFLWGSIQSLTPIFSAVVEVNN